MLLSGLSLTGNKVLYYPTQWGEGQWSHGVHGLGCKWSPCRWPRQAPQAWRSGWQEAGGSRAPAGPSGTSTCTVGRCCREPGPWPRPPRAGLTSVRGVTSSRETPVPIVSLPARFSGLGQEPAQKLDREVAGAHWRRGESGGLCRPGRPRPGFLQARVARPLGGQVKAQTRGDWMGTWSTAAPRPGPALTARAREPGGGGPSGAGRRGAGGRRPAQPWGLTCSSVSRLWGCSWWGWHSSVPGQTRGGRLGLGSFSEPRSH